jgi:hypothetical protein
VRRSLVIAALALLITVGSALALTPGDQRLAYRAQARLSDLPAGWRTAKTEKESGGSKCFAPERIAKPTGKSKRQFAQGEIAGLISIVVLYRSRTQTQNVYSDLASGATWDCLSDELRKQTHAKDVRQGRYLVRAPGQNVAREILVGFEQNGLSATFYAHAVLARKGRGLVFFVALDVFSPALSVSEESTLLRRRLARLP